MREPESNETIAVTEAMVRVIDLERHGAWHDVPAADFPLSHVITSDGALRRIVTMAMTRFGFAGYDETDALVVRGSLALDWPQPGQVSPH